MPFPEFNPSARKLLFFSRGRGRGHAVPDLEIVRKLQAIRDDIEIRFVSYSTGARTIEEAGFPLIDVELPAPGDDVRMTALSGRLIHWLKPDLVVTHEEFSVLPASKIFDRPTISILEWFMSPESVWMRSLIFADQILFLGEPSPTEEPPWVEGKVEYVGRLIREFEYGPKDRLRARAELGLPQDAFVVSAFPGAFATEERQPIADLLIAAFDQIPREAKVLAWIAGEDKELIQRKLDDRANALVFESISPYEKLMVASDVGVTKGNRGSAIDLVSLATPTVVVTHAQNPMDDKITAALEGAVQLKFEGLGPSQLAKAMITQATKGLKASTSNGKAASTCASMISEGLPRF